MPTLEELVVSGSEMDRELIATVLEPFIRFDGDKKGIIPMPPWDRLKNELKILVYLVARKALTALDWIDDDATSPKDVTRDTGLPGGSVRPALQRLVVERLVAQAKQGGYYVPNWAMNQVRAVLADEAKEVRNDRQ